MSTDRLSLRAKLALLLAGSAILFFVGIYLERGAIVPTSSAAVEPSTQPASSQPAEGTSSEAGEAGHTAAAASSPTAEGPGETAGEHAAETWPLGIDLEAPVLVGGVIVVSLALALAVVRTPGPLVPLAIAGFAVLFAVFDLLEVVHQVGQTRIGLAALAVVVLALHAAAGLVALRLFADRRLAMSAGA
jgi:hypothetical protein